MPFNIGNQIVSLKYYDLANTSDVNKRFQGIRPLGLYRGGYLTIADSSHADLSALICEISDGVYSVRIETTVSVNLSVAAGTPYIILRWTYTGATSDYMEILAVATPVANDIVVGKCTFSGGALNGIIYNDALYPRTKPDVQHLFLLVESTGEVERRVRIRGGQVMTTSGILNIADQKSDIFPAHSLKKVFLVYVDTSTGAILIDSSGIDAASPVPPDYKGKLVLAEVKLVSADTQIIASKIRDVRSFLSQNIEPDGVTIEKSDTTGKLQVKASYIQSLLPSFGSWSEKAKDTVYQAVTDGYVVVYGTGYHGGAYISIYTDSSNPPTTCRIKTGSGYVDFGASGMCPVKKGDYWKVTRSSTEPSTVIVYWLPFGS